MIKPGLTLSGIVKVFSFSCFFFEKYKKDTRQLKDSYFSVQTGSQFLYMIVAMLRNNGYLLFYRIVLMIITIFNKLLLFPKN